MPYDLEKKILAVETGLLYGHIRLLYTLTTTMFAVLERLEKFDKYNGGIVID